MTGTVVVFSGGLDSTVALALAVQKSKQNVAAIAFDYAQRNYRELAAAREIALHYGVSLHLCKLPKFGTSALTDSRVPVPHAHIDDPSQSVVVVPNRNMVMLAHAAALAVALQYDEVSMAIHVSEESLWTDSRPAFAKAMQTATHEATGGKVAAVFPFVNVPKVQVVRQGAFLGVPFALTYSCWEGGQVHCGLCGTCRERREAFEAAHYPDPTKYAT